MYSYVDNCREPGSETMQLFFPLSPPRAVCGLLLLPLVMERYKPEPEQLRDKVHRMWVEFTYIAKQLVLRLQQTVRKTRTAPNRPK